MRRSEGRCSRGSCFEKQLPASEEESPASGLLHGGAAGSGDPALQGVGAEAGELEEHAGEEERNVAEVT